MKYACLYSIVRFAPHAETEEFANIGVVLTAPAIGRMEYRLARKRWRRVNQFFEVPSLYAKAVGIAQEELESMRRMTAEATEAQVVNHFRYLTEPRESLIRFSPMRSLLVDDFEKALDQLVARFIERHQGGRERREEQMVRDIRSLFADASIRGFREDTLNGELTRLYLPLVHRNDVVAAIKPMAFDQDEPSAILDHCDQWVMKFARAANEGIVLPENVLIPLSAPAEEQSARHRKAVVMARRSIEQCGLRVVDFQSSQEITEFAKRYG